MSSIEWDKGTLTPPAESAAGVDWSKGTLAPPAKPRSTTRALGDLGVGFLTGAVDATKSVADAAGADNAVARGLGQASDFVRKGLSDQAVADQRTQQGILESAKGAGVWDQVKAAGSAFAVAPGQTVATGLGSVVPTIAAGLATGGASVPVSLGSMAAMGVAQGAGAVKGAIYDDVKKRSVEAGVSEPEAAARAERAQEYAGPNTANIAAGALLGAGDAVTGVSKVATSMLRRGAADSLAAGSTRGIVGRAVVGAAGEAPLEIVQGGQQQYATNMGAQRAGFDVQGMDGVVAQGLFEGLASVGPGAAFGAANRAPKTASVAEPTAAAEVEQSPVDGAAFAPPDVGVPQAEDPAPAPAMPFGQEAQATEAPAFAPELADDSLVGQPFEQQPELSEPAQPIDVAPEPVPLPPPNQPLSRALAAAGPIAPPPAAMPNIGPAPVDSPAAVIPAAAAPAQQQQIAALTAAVANPNAPAGLRRIQEARLAQLLASAPASVPPPSLTAAAASQAPAPAAAAALTGPAVYATYEEADAYRKEQKARGSNIQALPAPTQGGYTLATKGSPNYPIAMALQRQRASARPAPEPAPEPAPTQETAQAAPAVAAALAPPAAVYPTKGQARIAAKQAGDNFEVVGGQGGFTIRPARIEKAPDGTAADVQPVPAAAIGGGSAVAAPGVDAGMGIGSAGAGPLDTGRPADQSAGDPVSRANTPATTSALTPADVQNPTQQPATETQAAPDKAPAPARSDAALPAAGVPAGRSATVEAVGVGASTAPPVSIDAPISPPKSVPPKLKAQRQKIEAERATHFTPGNVVKSYGGHDRVVAYTPAGADGSGWSVRVQAVEQRDGKWVDVPNERERNHATQPDRKQLAAGMVERVSSTPVTSAPAAATEAASPDIRYSFAGPRAKTADGMAMTTAQDRLTAGEDAETVRQDTGWHRGVDGRWRFEISDADAKVNTTLLGNLSRGGFTERAIENVSYRKDDDGTFQISLVPKNPQRTDEIVSLRGVPQEMLLSILPTQAIEAIENGSGNPDLIGPNMDDAKSVRAPFDFAGFNALPLAMVLDHPKLFAAYPALREIMVQVDPKLGNGATFAVTDYVDGTVGKVIKLGNPTAKNVDSVLLHEIQHGIQDIEGFATGGSAGAWTIYRLDSKTKQAYERALDELPDDATEAQVKALAKDIYRRLAGEVEARNTQARASMTDAERRAAAPSSTADVSDKDVIVTFNGKEMANAPPPANAEPSNAEIAALARSMRLPMATVQSVRIALNQLVNGAGILPNQLGKIIVGTAADIKADWQPLVAGAVLESESAGDAVGFFDPNTKTVVLIADRIQAGQEMAVAAHELMHKHGEAVLGADGWAKLHGVLGGWATSPLGTQERAVYDEAAARVQASGPELSTQELFPYAVQVALEMGIKPNVLPAAGSVGNWLDRVRTSLREVWAKLTNKPDTFKAQDMVNLAFGIAQRENPALGQDLDRAANPMSALEKLSEADDLYATPRSNAQTVEEIAKLNIPTVKVRSTKFPGNETMYTLTMADETRATMTVRKSSKDSVYAADPLGDNEYNWLTGRPGENPEDVPPDVEDVWIDVSNLKSGQNGALVYNIAATFAYNTGRIFIGDPSGLSPMAMRRRPEQMLSSALKFGTTAHLAPHPFQTEGRDGVPPLRWIYGDHVGNIERLIDLNLQALDNAFPTAKNLSYDLESGTFRNAVSGLALPRGDLDRLLDRAFKRAGGAGASEDASVRDASGAGWRTVARGAVYRALLGRRGDAVARAGDQRGQGSGLRREGVLEGLVRQRAQLSSPVAEKRIFYSRSYALHMGEAVRGIAVIDLATNAGNRLSDYRGLGLAMLGRRQLLDVYGKDLPQLAEYNALTQQMAADKNDAGAGADRIATAWGKLTDERELAELMHDATLAQIDPAEPLVKGDSPVKLAQLKAKFDALTPEARAVYKEARDTYGNHLAAVRDAIRQRIERTSMSSERRAALLEKMDADFFQTIKGVYFPLARFGKYVVVTKGVDGKTANVTRAETLNEAQTARAELAKAYPAEQGFTVGKVLKDSDFNAGRDAVSRGFMSDLFGAIEKQGMSDDQRAQLEDAIGQLYLSAMPDLSWAKHGIHRKGTPGFSQDARRAFAQNVFHGARYLAKVNYSDRLEDELTAMTKHVDARNDDAAYPSIAMRDVVTEMEKRHESMMNPQTSSISTALTSFGFVFHLGLSPSSAMVNVSQTALVAYPIMAARWGVAKSAAALLKASKETASNKNDITAALSPDEKRAYDEAVRNGTIDVTMAHDLAGIAQGEDSQVSMAIRPVMKWASFLFHHAEKFNRQVTFVAAYRLAREAGTDHQVAFEQATKATYDGHFDYAAENRPRFMQGNAAKVLLLFKQYAQNMVYTFTRQAQQAIKAERPEDRAEARKVLAGLLVSHAMGAGVLGLPLVTTLLAAASMIGGSEDEPWDAKVALQNMLADSFGSKAAEVLAHGLSRLTPWDISGRVGLDHLILPDIQEGLEGQRLGESAMAAALGPVAGIGINVLKGAQDISEGRMLRGLESMVPAVLRGPMKAIRLANEGAVDKSGIPIVEDVSAAGVAGQFLGFSPSEVRNATEGRGAVLAADRALTERRSSLTKQFADASVQADQEGMAEARGDIAAWNKLHPNRSITPQNLFQSVRARQKRVQEAENGVYLPVKRRDVADAGRFALAD